MRKGSVFFSKTGQTSDSAQENGCLGHSVSQRSHSRPAASVTASTDDVPRKSTCIRPITAIPVFWWGFAWVDFTDCVQALRSVVGRRRRRGRRLTAGVVCSGDLPHNTERKCQKTWCQRKVAVLCFSIGPPRHKKGSVTRFLAPLGAQSGVIS